MSLPVSGRDRCLITADTGRLRFGRDQTIYNPWHYVPGLARKPGALRNGAPFKDWVLPAHLERVRSRLKGSDDGDRQMVKILSAVLSDGRGAAPAAGAARRLRPLRSLAPGRLMKRSEILELMQLKLFGMRPAGACPRAGPRPDPGDEVMASALKRGYEPARVIGELCSPPRSPRSRRARSSIR